MPDDYSTTSKRLPKLPPREEVDPAELADYDFMLKRLARFAQSVDLVDGQPYGLPHFTALAAAPPMGRAISELGWAIQSQQDKPNRYTARDHEMIDLVLGFDSDYWALAAGHTPSAIAAGIRIEALEALATGREQDLSDEERQQVEFIRAVRDGGMTDEIWNAMKERVGSERGVLDFVGHILLLLFHHRFCWAVGAPQMKREDWWRMLEQFKNGTRRVPEYHNVFADPNFSWDQMRNPVSGTKPEPAN